MFDRSEIEPEFRELTKEELRRKKISEAARKRRRTKNGRFRVKDGPGKWVPSKEFCQMVVDTLIEEGFPKSRIRLDRKNRKVRLRWRCRGYDETHFVFRKFYTPHHVRQFLKLWMRWDDPERRPKRGRPKKPAKEPKPRSLDRRTKAWRSKMLHQFRSPLTGIQYPLIPRRGRE